MNPADHPSQLDVRFSVPAEHAFNALETVLAIARRGALSLFSLELGPAGTKGDHVVRLALRADEADPLALFMLRLQNVIDIDNVSAQELPERRAA
ncbi:hypothetical protein [Massilia glaciei]|uniref:Acetolactate synthase n=1 Tax=Massilia glaciei TaxID=1524097 RepID=A0A2U2I4Y5_9BURK|nr:hypothetical protein [Massilia glaciei]PWF54777.1 hypothetical protein C7C56_005245 [Massilia glaciei]